MIRAFVHATILSAVFAKDTTKPHTGEPLKMSVAVDIPGVAKIEMVTDTSKLNKYLEKALAGEPPRATKPIEALHNAIQKAAAVPAVRTVADRRSDLEKNPTWMQQFGKKDSGAQCGLYMVQAIGYLLGAASKEALPKKQTFVDYAKGIYNDFYAIQLPADHAKCVAILNAQGITDDFGLVGKSGWGLAVVCKGIQSMGLESNGHGMVPHAMKTYWPAKCDSKVVAWAVLTGFRERGHWSGLVRSSNDVDTKWTKVCSFSGVSVLDHDQAKKSLENATSIFPLTLNGAKPPVFGTPASATSPAAPKTGVPSAVPKPGATQSIGKPQPQNHVSKPGTVKPPVVPGYTVKPEPVPPATAA